MEGNTIGDAKTNFLEDIFFESWVSIGIPIEMLGASCLGCPVPCGQRNDSNRGGIGYGPTIYLLGRVVENFTGSSDMLQLVEHGAPASSVWIDDHRD